MEAGRVWAWRMVRVGVRRVGRMVLRIVGAGKDQSMGSIGESKELEGSIPVPRTLRDGRWRLIMDVIAAWVGCAQIVTSPKATKNL